MEQDCLKCKNNGLETWITYVKYNLGKNVEMFEIS